MANTRSAQKAMRQAERRALRNQGARSAVRTFTRKATAAVGAGGEGVADVVREAIRSLDKAAQKGIIHRNAAARRKSRLMARLYQLSVAAVAEPAPAEKKRTSTSRSTASKRTGGSTSSRTGDKKPATPRTRTTSGTTTRRGSTRAS